MDFDLFSDQLKGLGKRVSTLKDNVLTEEATKTSLIMPFFQILGYDIFNPLEFVPEFTADVGIKKGEKVDYAIIMDSNPVMLIEAKAVTESLTLFPTPCPCKRYHPPQSVHNPYYLTIKPLFPHV